jgi:tetratricopeptide (TPR) repeat protein
MAHKLVLRPEKTAAPAQSPLAAAHAKLIQAETARRNGHLDAAQALAEALVRQHPDYVGALQTLGVVYLTKQSYWEALSCFNKVAIQCPRDWINLTNLAAVYVALGGNELAARTLEEARRLKPDDPEIHVTMGEVYRDQREYELAAQAYQRALDLQPNHLTAALGVGDSCSHLGRYAEAAAAYETLHRLKPESAGCLYGLSQLPANCVKVDILAALEKVDRLSHQTEDDFRALVGYTRAAVLHRRGDSQEAWDCLVMANRSDWPTHEAGYRKQVIRQDASRAAAGKLSPLRNEDRPSRPDDHPQSLFIIGPSRSGKTTLERLVSELEGARRGYESHFIERAVQRASQGSGLLTISRLTDLPKPLDDKFRRYYLEEIGEIAGQAKLFTNTHPGMIYHLGRVAEALPSSRFVFVKRDVHDIAFRIFGKRYKAGNHYAYDLKAVFEYVSWYHQMVDIWLEKLLPVTRVIQYEDMIADPRTALKVVADLCELPMPEGPLPELGDDRGCAAPYRERMAEALHPRSTG